MNDILDDLEFSDDLRSRLSRASSLEAPDGLQRRVTERTRAHRRRSAAGRAGIVGLAAAAGVGVVLTRTNAPNAEPQESPASGADGASPLAQLAPSPNPDKVDYFPIVDAPSGVVSYGSDDVYWSGAVGAYDADGLPARMIGITVFGPGSDLFPGLTPGRVPGVWEFGWGGGRTLVSTVENHRVSVVSREADLDDAYAVMAMVSVDASTGSYTLDGSLPTGLTELTPPRHHAAGRLEPSINDTSDDSGALFGVEVANDSALHMLTNYAAESPQSVRIDDRPGFTFTSGGDAVVLIATAADESVAITSGTMHLAELKSFVDHKVRFVDEAEFRSHYDVAGVSNPTGSGGEECTLATIFESGTDGAESASGTIGDCGSQTPPAPQSAVTSPATTAPSITSP